MRRKKIAYLSVAVLFLLLVSFFIYSQINEEQLLQGDFIDILIQVMGLEEDLPGYPGETPQEQGMNLLTDLGYTPWGGWNPTGMLTKGDVALVLAVALGYMDKPEIELAANRDLVIAQAFEVLAARGIPITGIPTGKPEDPLTEVELAQVINTASGVTGGQINPYPEILSPTTE